MITFFHEQLESLFIYAIYGTFLHLPLTLVMINLRYTSLEGSEINVIATTFGCLTYTLVYGLNLIYMVNSHKGGFLIPLLLQTPILLYMAGRFPQEISLILFLNLFFFCIDKC